jgi:aspartyl-tRNA synthetase
VKTSSVNKFYNEEDLAKIIEKFGAKEGDLMLILSGNENKVRAQLSALRMELGNRLGLRKGNEFAPLWVVDFLYWNGMKILKDTMQCTTLSRLQNRKIFIYWKQIREKQELMLTIWFLTETKSEVDLSESLKDLQSKMFDLLGFSKEEAEAQFGFLMNAFKYGAPPHGGLAFGFDRLVAILDGNEVIRDYIAFPKNNSGRDVMIDAPASIADAQLDELELKLDLKA